jgi:hypothetical protein
MIFLLMSQNFLPVVVLPLIPHLAEAQTTIYSSPDNSLRAVIIPVGKKGNEGTESRVEIRSATGETLGWKSFASYDGEHGIGVNHAEWTADGQFFVFNVASSAGHQPWRRATYFYSRGENRFYSLDDYIGPVTSDFTIEGRNVVKTTRFNFEAKNEKELVRVNLGRPMARKQ